MKKQERETFVRTFINNMERHILEKVTRDIPELDNWDGTELRRYMAEKFEQERVKRLETIRRVTEYNNTIMIYNL